MFSMWKISAQNNVQQGADVCHIGALACLLFKYQPSLRTENVKNMHLFVIVFGEARIIVNIDLNSKLQDTEILFYLSKIL